MNPEHIERLKQEQAKAISETADKLKQFEKFKDDYKNLATRLKTLPDKISHQIRVPFGKLAFMPGELIHTNEVMVLLGDNWFAQRSATQARAIIDRRVAAIDKNIEELKLQQGLLEPRLEYTSQLAEEATSDAGEIREDFDPRAENAWREQHKKNVQKHKQQLRKERESLQAAEQEPTKTDSAVTDEELWARLDELEKQERRRGEMRNIGIDDASTSVSNEGGREVHWDDGNHTSRREMESEEASSETGDTEEEEEEESERPNIITFKHTATEDIKQPANTGAKLPVNDTPPQTITSPSDIYKCFGQSPEPKSILKSPSSTQSSEHREGRQPSVKFHQDARDAEHKGSKDVALTRPAAQEPAVKAFTATVVEKQPTQADNLASGEPLATSASLPTSQPPKPMSKFKQRKLGLDKR